MKKSLALIALLMAATTAIAQVPVLQKPVLAPQTKPAIKPIVLRTPITVVNPAAIASNSPNREEAARRLKAQNIPAAAALAALRGAFSASGREDGRALRGAGYGNLELLTAIKQADGLSASSMFKRMESIGISPSERAPLLRQLYALDFDALLAAMNDAGVEGVHFGFALHAMGYGVEEMVATGYRYFVGGFPDPNSGGGPYPGPGEMYDLLKYLNPLASQVQIDHYALWVLLMQAGYPPVLMAGEVRYGAYRPNGQAADAVANCVASTHLSADDPLNPPAHVNPRLLIRIAPDGSASHSDQQRRCFVPFLSQLRTRGVARTVAAQLADASVHCMPQTNPACPAQMAEVAARMVAEAGYPPEKN